MPYDLLAEAGSALRASLLGSAMRPPRRGGLRPPGLARRSLEPAQRPQLVELLVRGREVAVAVPLEHLLEALGERLRRRLVELAALDARVEPLVLRRHEVAVDLDIV